VSNVLIVSVFGVDSLVLHSGDNIPEFETSEIDCRCYPDSKDLMSILDKDNPGVVVSFGESTDYPELMAAPYEVRRKWLNFKRDVDSGLIGKNVFESFINGVCNPSKDIPLVSVFTPSYKTGKMIDRPYNSLMAQEYANWEWVVIDDSEDDETFKILSEMAAKDCRIRPYKADKHSGMIGELKRDACGLCRGEYLLELDHDDELTPWALSELVKAYEKYPEAGFVYSDFAECFEDGGPVKYPDGWGFGYGSYRDEVYNGQTYAVVNSPNVNAKTIRHIVAAPNHLRSWRKSVYNEIEGHNPSMHVVDDYELMVRTFLATRMVRIPRMCYVQYRNQEGNTHKARNKEIQRLVRYVSITMDDRIHKRLLELGVDDFVWEEGTPSFFRLSVPNQDVESHCTITMDE